MCRLFLSVQNIDCKVEIGGEGYPEQIGDLQVSCKRTYTLEKHNHCHDNCEQKQNPDECKQICLHIKEDKAPNKIDGKVYAGKYSVAIPVQFELDYNDFVK